MNRAPARSGSVQARPGRRTRFTVPKVLPASRSANRNGDFEPSRTSDPGSRLILRSIGGAGSARRQRDRHHGPCRRRHMVGAARSPIAGDRVGTHRPRMRDAGFVNGTGHVVPMMRCLAWGRRSGNTGRRSPGSRATSPSLRRRPLRHRRDVGPADRTASLSSREGPGAAPGARVS